MPKIESMKNLFLLTIFWFTIATMAAQNDYDRGFRVGYKEGYCYNDFGCLAPITPLTPIPYLGENMNSYQDGYNRGFKMGTEDKQRDKTKTSTSRNYGLNRNQNQQTNQWNTIEKVEPGLRYTPIDLSLLEKALDKRQETYDNNLKYVNSLIDWIYELKLKTSEKEFLEAMANYYQKLRKFDGQDLSLLGNDIRKIELEIKEEIDRYNTRLKDLPRQFWEKGNENFKKANFSEAIKDYTNLIEISPEFIQAYLQRGICYQNIGNYLSALRDFDKFIEVKNDEPYAFSSRGWVKYYLKDYIGAMADFNKQIELDKSEVAYYNRGSAKSELGDKNGAISDYNKAIEINPKFSMAYNNRGWSKYELKKYSEALADINKAIELDPKNWVAYDSRQETKFALNDIKGCIEDCNIALSLNAKVANPYLFRGKAYFKQGNKAKACEDWRKAGELGLREAYEFISKNCNN